MSLVEFKARNHPQQETKPFVDDRETTPEDFARFHERFRFTVDVAASKENAKLQRFYTAEEDGCEQSWSAERVWCNPPYSEIARWVEKAWAEWSDPNPGQYPPQLVVMLLPANRTEQNWWQTWVEPYRRSGELTIEFLRGRMRFIPPGEDSVKPNSRPPFGCCLVIWGDPNPEDPTSKHRPLPPTPYGNGVRDEHGC